MIFYGWLDNDYYKFKISNFVFSNYNKDIIVEYKLFNRGVNPLNVSYEEMKEIMESIFSYTGLENDEIDYLEKVIPNASKEWLKSLSDVTSKTNCRINRNDKTIYIKGPWWQTTLFEIPIMHQIAEKHYENELKKLNNLDREILLSELKSRSVNKIKLFNKNKIVLNEFGTRRRFSSKHQVHVIYDLYEYMDKDLFLGTSNVLYCKICGKEPKGTMAHELFMVVVALAEELFSQVELEDQNIDTLKYLINTKLKNLVDKWYNFYGKPSSIILPDTFGSEHFFDNIFTKDYYEQWIGSRQDSGNPFDYMNLLYKKFGDLIKDKLTLFSDNLNPDSAIEIFNYSKNYTKPVICIGTNLTCDVPDFINKVNIVVKPIKANGITVVKLSDDSKKITSDDLEKINLLKKIFNHNKQIWGY